MFATEKIALRLPLVAPPTFTYYCATCEKRFSTATRPAYPRPHPESWSYDCAECAQTQALMIGSQGLWLSALERP